MNRKSVVSVESTTTSSPTITPTSSIDEISMPKHVERFLAKITVSEDGHWLFGGARSGNGYGVCHVEGNRAQLAHRASYDFFVGDLPGDDYVIGHASGCPRNCVNPEHLSIITRSQNQQQRKVDGTMYVVKRQIVKATPAEIAEIRERAGKGETKYSIAQRLNRSETYIALVVKGSLHSEAKAAERAERAAQRVAAAAAKLPKKRGPKPASSFASTVLQEAA